ncbi:MULTISPECIES: TetR/AcrR family transcriptional regulator [unclassified Nonomuraea]|uniref:TetR/AcrR family transcriptional regulator n=1 Tax=unclassified Nonomuraea TaxID=2593643 RepID=UPI0033E99DC1
MTRTAASSRRSERSRVAILNAAMELCTEEGFGGVTIEKIAARARVGKPTIYRWWTSKHAVILDAFMEHIAPELTFPQTGDPLEDLRGWLHAVARLLGEPRLGPLMAGVIGAAQHDAALAEEFHRRVYAPTRERTAGQIRRIQDEGRLPAIPPDLLVDLIMGPLWLRLLLVGDPPGPDYVNAVLAAVASNENASAERGT